jgi:hypothetical protein
MRKKKSERTVVIGGFAKEASSCRFENGKKSCWLLKKEVSEIFT